MIMTTDLSKNKSNRLLALDVFRGLTVIGMIVVNSPNTSGELSHAYWQWLMFADLVFPFFIFIVGVSISLGNQHIRLDQQGKSCQIIKIIHRTALLFILGLFVNLLYLDFAQFRLLGVLQRIAIVYAVCSVMNLYLSSKQLLLSAMMILVSYWLLIILVAAPGLEAGVLQHSANIINWFDQQYLPGMLWRGTWDPEGVLSTYPAIVSGLAGVLVGNIIINSKGLPSAVNVMFIGGLLSCIAGYYWSFNFPFIKQLWTSSFVLITSGLAAMLLASLLWLTDIKQSHSGIYFAKICGVNATFAYVLHVVLHVLFDSKILGTSIHSSYVELMVTAGINDTLSAAVWIILFLSVCFLPLHQLYQKKIFIKI